jgi:hypothetical protein
VTTTLYFNQPTEPRMIAMRIGKHLASIMNEVDSSDGYDLCARMFGYADWPHLMATHGIREASQPDADVAPDELHARVSQYLHAAERRGLSLDQAWKLISDVTVGDWLGVGRFVGKPAWQ